MPSTAIAKYYDEIAKSTKPEQVLEQELGLITALTKPGSQLLDIACGTGRHLLPLLNLNYFLTGIDIEAEHLNQLKSKYKGNSPLDLLQGDFLTVPIKKKFTSIIVFWNSLNEICLTKKSLSQFFKKTKELILDNGFIIINIDNIELLDLKHLEFSNKYELENGVLFTYDFQQLSFDPKSKISKSLETVKISFNGKLREKAEGMLIQRWWSLPEIEACAQKLGLTITVKHIPANSELYLIVRK